MCFPHLADGGGYGTQFILFSGSEGQAASGSLILVQQLGQPFVLAANSATSPIRKAAASVGALAAAFNVRQRLAIESGIMAPDK